MSIEIQDRDRYATGMNTQLESFHRALARGMPRIGWKVGINVPEVLAALKLSHSGVGWLDGNHVYENGALIAYTKGADLRLEPELAIHMGGTVSAHSDAASARAQILGVSPAFEIVDYARPKEGLDSIVGHSMFHFASVLGESKNLESISEMGTRWPKLEVASAKCPAPRADLVPDDLGRLICFVAKFLQAFGETLEAGDIILSGSYTSTAIEIPTGTCVRADFGELGSLSVRV